MTPGARYRAKSSGSVYEVVRIGKTYVLRMVDFSKPHRVEIAAEAKRRGDDVGFALQRYRATKLEVEPAWFKHAATEVTA